jgi:2-polyprenyl-3-methyl-5-hydroxy-6-metoxy-1,4-benzoquinol methylase
MTERDRRKATTGWFVTRRRAGDRTIQQQMTGLEPLLADVSGRSVLDVGCAEGLIGVECAKAGASKIDGVELVAGHVDLGLRLARKWKNVRLQEGDANSFVPAERYDVVLLLAILHKLRNPSQSCRTLADACEGLCVIRYPSSSVGEVIVDDRSQCETHDIGAVMLDLGFLVEQVTAGPFAEQTYFYRR